MNLRVLLVESDPEDLLFLQDVLNGIESGRYWSNWVHIEILYAAAWSEAAAILADQSVDAILLDLDLIDSQGAETFRRAQGAAPQIPIVLLMGREDEALAARMVREGAQDFLLKEQVDCAPLAHALRNAIERHRVLNAARASAIADQLTGLPNRSGFFAFADRDRMLAGRLGRRLMIIVAEPDTAGEDEQHRDLILVETADRLRSLCSPTDLLARIGPARFALAILDTDAEPLEQAWARISTARKFGIALASAIFDAEHPAPLDTLLEQATLDLAPAALAVRR
jgi:PleD family two-component response regulator